VKPTNCIFYFFLGPQSGNDGWMNKPAWKRNDTRGVGGLKTLVERNDMRRSGGLIESPPPRRTCELTNRNFFNFLGSTTMAHNPPPRFATSLFLRSSVFDHQTTPHTVMFFFFVSFLFCERLIVFLYFLDLQRRPTLPPRLPHPPFLVSRLKCGPNSAQGLL